VIRKLGPGPGGGLPAEMERFWKWEKW